MPQIIFIEPNGNRSPVEVPVGVSLMQATMPLTFPRIAACACATCHVHVAPDWADRLGPRSGNEESMLEFAVDVDDFSRLSCQIKMTEALDGLVVRVAEVQL